MAKFLFTMWAANDLGLPSRLVPIARALADRGHEVAAFNPSPAPASLIAEAGLKNLPMPAHPVPAPAVDLSEVHLAWDAEQLLAPFYLDEAYVQSVTAMYIDLLRGYGPDVVVDSFDLIACLAARILKVPLVTVLQATFHPESDGFLWWKAGRPQNIPSAAHVVNKVAAQHGLPPLPRCLDRMTGDLSLIVGTPETDPLPAGAGVTYIGPMVWQRQDAVLPGWVESFGRERPLIWVYSGNPRYGGNVATPGDSIVVIRAAVEALAGAPVQVILTTGFQDIPAEIGSLPPNFRHAAYLPGLAMSQRSDLMVHHGGHGSTMTGLLAGTPAVIIPTISEREGNARRATALGAGEIVLPTESADGEKHVDVADFRAKIDRVLRNPAYRASAQRVSASMRRHGGPPAAADLIEKFAGESRRAAGRT